MQTFLRRTTVFPFLLAILVGFPLRGLAAPGPTEIRLGKAATAAAKADPAQVRAIERFFAARQTASLDRTRLLAARRMLMGITVDDATLAGDPGTVLAAFDFTDGAIERLANGRFRVSVYLLFADRQGKVVRSRDEILTFASGPGGTATCIALKPASDMRWDAEVVARTAARLHVSQALERADEFLQGWATRQTSLAAYSIEDVYPTGVNRVMIPCLQFSAQPGKRGYDVVDTPIMMRRGSKGFEVEPPAN